MHPLQVNVKPGLREFLLGHNILITLQKETSAYCKILKDDSPGGWHIIPTVEKTEALNNFLGVSGIRCSFSVNRAF